MEQKENENAAYWGRLPEWAPLANPYVPDQQEDPAMYHPGKALIRGTLYPGLDLPLHGMVNRCEKKKTPMTELQELGFCLTELAEYLDTHADDGEVYELYCKYRKGFREACARYSEHVRPLDHRGMNEARHYAWLRDPWPWEYAANQGV